MMRRSVIAIAVALSTGAPSARGDSVTAGGFEIRLYAEGLTEPTAMDFAPDGRMFVAEKNGHIRIVDGGAVLEKPFATLNVHNLFESGLIGLVLDPDFEQNHYVYAFVTSSFDEQQILRYTEVDGVGTDPTVIRRNLPSGGTIHNGGDLEFGPDGKLYFSIGDNAVSDFAQDMSTLAGTICRIDVDGTTPADNPFTTPTGAPRASYAFGFRNPFRFCFAPDGRMFATDVGSFGAERREEINLVRAGNNYGWPLVEGTTDPQGVPQYTGPIFDYYDEGSSITGIVFYAGGQFPEEYSGNLFHLEYTINRVYRVVLDGDTVVRHTLFAEVDGGPVDLVQGPDGCLYLCELVTGNIKQIYYTGDGDSCAIAEHESEEPPSSTLCATGAVLPMLAAFVILLSGFKNRRAGSTQWL